MARRMTGVGLLLLAFAGSSCEPDVSTPEGVVRARFAAVDVARHEEAFDWELAVLQWEIECMEIESRWLADTTSTIESVQLARGGVEFMKERMSDLKDIDIYIVNLEPRQNGDIEVWYKYHKRAHRYNPASRSHVIDDKFPNSMRVAAQIEGKWKVRKPN